MLADSDAGQHHPANERRGFGDIVERDLAMVTHQVVGEQRHPVDDAMAAEGEVARLCDVDVHFDGSPQPGVAAVLRRERLEPAGSRDGRTQLLLSPAEYCLQRVVLARKLDLRA